MKCIIIYYSQTGNTEKIAKAIQSGIEQAGGYCDIVKMQGANPRNFHEGYDVIGMGTPVWGDEPDNAKVFIKAMRYVGGKQAFIFSTHGSSPEMYFSSIYPKLKRQGLKIIGMADWYGNCYLYHHCAPYPTQGHPDDIDVKEAKAFGSDMVDRSRRISAGEKGLLPPPPNPLPKGGLRAYVKRIAKDGEDKVMEFKSMLKYHKEKCLYPKCGLCMDNCPVYGIDLTRKPPIIAKPCGNCEWCIRICPTGALEALDWLDKMQPNMAIMTQRDVLPRLARAEAEGRFRRLIPEKEITGVLNYKVYTKHPQWIIGKGLQRGNSDTK